jgi:hypothetical protein
VPALSGCGVTATRGGRRRPRQRTVRPRAASTLFRNLITTPTYSESHASFTQPPCTPRVSTSLHITPWTILAHRRTHPLLNDTAFMLSSTTLVGAFTNLTTQRNYTHPVSKQRCDRRYQLTLLCLWMSSVFRSCPPDVRPVIVSSTILCFYKMKIIFR